MKNATALIALLLAAQAGIAFADDVTCESKGSKRVECPMDTAGAVRLVKQLSNSPCTEGVSWGLSKHAVWVENGCRGVFTKDAQASNGGGDAAASGGIPLLNASCPGNIDVHADQGGPVYINGKEGQLKRFNKNYFEAKDAHSGVVISLSINPDGTPSVSYTGKGRANGVCQVHP